MRAILSFALLVALSAPAHGQTTALSGVWQRAKGTVRIAFSPCGPDLCGKIVWLDPDVKTKAHIGDRIFYDLTRSPEGWKGRSFSPQENKTYTVTLSMQGTLLQSRECMFEDRICRAETWTRVN